MLVSRKRTTNPVTVLVGLAAVATAATVAACGSSPAPGSSGSAPSQPGSPSGGAALRSSSGVCSSVPKLTALTVRRVNALPRNHLKFVFPATDMVTSATQVRTVATSLCALPRAKGSMSCPMDQGVSYQLTFAEGSTKFAAVKVEAGGCATVTGAGAPRRALPPTKLWQNLGLAVGISNPTETTFSGSQGGATQ